MNEADAPAPYWPAWLSAEYADNGTPVPYWPTPAAEAELEAGQ